MLPLLIAGIISSFPADAQSPDTRPELLALSTLEFHRYGAPRVLLVDTVIHVGAGDELHVVHSAQYATLAARRLPMAIASISVVPAAAADRALVPDTTHVSLLRLVDRTGASGTPVIIALVIRATRPALVLCVVRRVGTEWRVDRTDMLGARLGRP